MSVLTGRIVVLGAEGFLGSAFARELAGHPEVDGLYWTRAHGDLTRRENMAAALFQQDYAILCAAKIGGIAEQRADPSMPVTENLVLGARFLEACAKAKVKRALLVSSSTVYPAWDEPMEEEFTRHGGIPGRDNVYEDLAPASVYEGVGGVKLYLESLAEFYHHAFGLHTCVIRPTAVYGPGDRSTHVIPDLIRRSQTERPLRIWGKPDTIRDFVYVDDVVRAGIMALASAPPIDPVNVGSGQATTIGELAREVLLAVHGPDWFAAEEDKSSTGPIVFDETKPQAIPVRRVDISKAERVLGWKPEVGLVEGLRRTVEWMREQTGQAH